MTRSRLNRAARRALQAKAAAKAAEREMDAIERRILQIDHIARWAITIHDRAALGQAISPREIAAVEAAVARLDAERPYVVPPAMKS